MHLVDTAKRILQSVYWKPAMKITTKELRIQPGRIINQAANGQEVTITFRGKTLARIVPISEQQIEHEKEQISIFGMWRSHQDEKSVEESACKQVMV